ncbi:urea ABC transporter permease subunit UrtB [Bradyrhizobium erythrophlei]|jgi:urea transport system permease protein|uniref:Amino acid/amide ABC transporter membrane protein 1, HAAT family n=1 Tax=Bradyrhizobium erythrophlei TaxID=1437360 RepID=A0A1M5L1W3_9BRAD|nr:urea ABC transporter permease subunit UrtB [Bradyrhizobium erythrophlei]SHG58976.1 amino acid/amide ABC transporter membrane protein 1, HAAT family [Bradyrhizobium erythrophlei]
MHFVFEQVLTGLSIGSILLLVALGLSIIYGTIGVINLAHGEFIMLGAYAAWALKAYAGLSLLPGLVLIFLGVGLFGWLVERFLLRRLYRRPLDTILATWGVGVVLQQVVRLTAGGELRYVELPPSMDSSVSIFGVEIAAYRIFIFVVTALLFLISWSIMYRTTFGLKLRAVVQDRNVASCFGINADRIYSLTFAYGAGLAGLAGAIVSPLKSVSPEMGTGYVVDAFMVVVLGGVQSLFGTVISAFVMGEVTGAIAFLQNDTIAKAAVLIVIISVIRFRPQGLFVAKVRA